MLILSKNKSMETSFDKKFQGEKSAKLKTLKILLSDFKEQTKMRKLDKGVKGYKEKDYLASVSSQANILKNKSTDKSNTEISKKINTSPVKPEKPFFPVQLYDMSNSKTGKNETSFLEGSGSNRMKRETILKKKNISTEFWPENLTPVSKKQALAQVRPEKCEEEDRTELQHKRFQFSLKQENIIYKNINSRLRQSIQEKSTELHDEGVNTNHQQSNLVFEIKKRNVQAVIGSSQKLIAGIQSSKGTSNAQLVSSV
jgi:hypothetical protein